MYKIWVASTHTLAVQLIVCSVFYLGGHTEAGFVFAAGASAMRAFWYATTCTSELAYVMLAAACGALIPAAHTLDRQLLYASWAVVLVAWSSRLAARTACAHGAKESVVALWLTSLPLGVGTMLGGVGLVWLRLHPVKHTSPPDLATSESSE